MQALLAAVLHDINELEAEKAATASSTGVDGAADPEGKLKRSSCQ